MGKLILSKREVAKELGCSMDKVNFLINKGYLRLFVGIANEFPVKILASSLHSYVNNNSYTMDQINNELNNDLNNHLKAR